MALTMAEYFRDDERRADDEDDGLCECWPRRARRRRTRRFYCPNVELGLVACFRHNAAARARTKTNSAAKDFRAGESPRIAPLNLSSERVRIRQ